MMRLLSRSVLAVFYWPERISVGNTVCTLTTVDVRKRMGQAGFDEFHQVIIEAVEQGKTKKSVKIDEDEADSGKSMPVNSAQAGIFARQ